jgi:predicted DNA-binding antitoxin AbrB/MazE fold protein
MIARPISAIYKKGHFVPTEKLRLPENSYVHLVLVDLSKMSEKEIEWEKASAQDYFKFEAKNDCAPTDEELTYYYKIATHEAR